MHNLGAVDSRIAGNDVTVKPNAAHRPELPLRDRTDQLSGAVALNHILIRCFFTFHQIDCIPL